MIRIGVNNLCGVMKGGGDLKGWHRGFYIFLNIMFAQCAKIPYLDTPLIRRMLRTPLFIGMIFGIICMITKTNLYF